jgi:DNA sulfur modification protein DndE
MTWKVFGGEYADTLMALLLWRHRLASTVNPNYTALSEAQYLRCHLHRGIGYLAGRTGLNSISNLVEMSAGIDALHLSG